MDYDNVKLEDYLKLIGFKDEIISLISSYIYDSKYTEWKEEYVKDYEKANSKYIGDDPFTSLIFQSYYSYEVRTLYKERQIKFEYYIDTMKDIPIWANEYEITSNGKYGLMENCWIINHLTCNIIRLGRLQYQKEQIDKTLYEILKKYNPELNVNVGDYFLRMHVPKDGKLDEEEVNKSIKLSKEFFKDDGMIYLMDSWIIFPTVEPIFKEGSNLQKFKDRFHYLCIEDKNDCIKKYLYRNFKNEKETPFNKRIKDYVEKYGPIGSALGILIK